MKAWEPFKHKEKLPRGQLQKIAHIVGHKATGPENCSARSIVASSFKVERDLFLTDPV